MDSLGTITVHFPFIDAETKRILESKMNEASDYTDFVERLGEEILNSICSDLVVYLGIYHAALAMNFNLINRIKEMYGGRDMLDPSLYYYSAYQGRNEDLEKVHETADAYLATNPEDWIALETYFVKFEASMRHYPKTMYKTSTLDKILSLMESDPRLGFNDAPLNDYMSRRAATDGNTEERIRCIDRGIETAEKFDDRVRLCDLLIKKAHILKDHDREKARKLLERAYEISEVIGIAADYAEIIDKLGKLDAVRGKFDNAIKNLRQSVSILERAGIETGNESLLLSTFFNVIGEAESGYEWGCMAEDQFESRPHLKPRAILNQAWSLILLDKRPEASILIETTRESIIKSGIENILAWLHFVSGILEMSEGDFLSSASSIGEALKIYETLDGAYMIQLIFLYNLAKAEVNSCARDSIVSPSLAILEEKAIEEDLPGFMGLVMLLKADIAIATKDDAGLTDIIRQLRPLAENEGLQFLMPLYEGLLKRV
jgi:tetratricopeptide (TPR) repeat protein